MFLLNSPKLGRHGLVTSDLNLSPYSLIVVIVMTMRIRKEVRWNGRIGNYINHELSSDK